MAHRHVTDKDGKSKYIHSSHGDVAHPAASGAQASVKPGQSERNAPHGHNAHPNDLGGAKPAADADGDHHSGGDMDEDEEC